ncbi:MAG: hypothetical protein ABIJ42_00305, partial [Acidobacteriota bacterium]
IYMQSNLLGFVRTFKQAGVYEFEICPAVSLPEKEKLWLFFTRNFKTDMVYGICFKNGVSI